MKAPKMPIGIEDFGKLRNQIADYDGSHFTIADKTSFLPSLLISPNEVTVFTRPIRFMKSSTFSMMEKFLSIRDIEENAALFNGLDISDDKYSAFREKYQGQFPIIYLTFKSIKKSIRTWDVAKAQFGEIMSNLYEEHSYVLSSLSEIQKKRYNRILNEESDERSLELSLANMITYLSKFYNKKVIVLIDEYDTPFQSAYSNTAEKDIKKPNSYFHLMSDFLSGFLSDALKGHLDLEKSFMTGVSYFSLNNTKVYSIFTPEYAELFGFTESEVEDFIGQVKGIKEEERSKIRKTIQRWYNGYYIGNKSVRIYNPWSVAQFFNNLPTNSKISGQAYWLEVGKTMALSDHLEPRFSRLNNDLTNLMLRKSIKIKANKRMELVDLHNKKNDSSFWGLLLHAGYLSASNIEHHHESIFICEVSIPNYEVHSAYAHLIIQQQQKYDPGLKLSSSIIDALLDGNIPKFSTTLKILMEQAISFYDLPKESSDKKILREQVYHAFILGLLAGMLTDYKIKSNHESGYGRYDIMLIPRDKSKHGFIFELKSTNNTRCLAEAASFALKQIEEKRYPAELEGEKIPAIFCIGMSFYGKLFHIEHRVVNYTPEELPLL